MGALIAMSTATSALAAATPPEGTYVGTLACEATVANPSEPAFSAPVSIKVAGSGVTWVRETPAMREVIAGTLANGSASFDGFGGSVSAATKQAFWDWKVKANLVYTSEGFRGPAQMLSKDGGDVLRNCSFASAPARPATTASASEPPARLLATASTSATDKASASDLAEREEALRKKEEALASRESMLKEREQGLASHDMAPPSATRTAGGPATPSPSVSPSDAAQLAENTARVLASAVVEGVRLGAGAQGGRAAVPVAVLQTMQQQMRANPPQADAASSVPPGMTVDARPPSAGTPVAWPTKEALLAATRKGEFVRVTNITYYGDAQFTPLLRSVSYVLASEYRVPPLPSGAQGCGFQYSDNVLAFMRAINGRHLSTLNNQPPEFYNPPRDSGPAPETLVRRVTDSANCDLEIVGMRRVHPYKQALIQFMGEYGQATKDYVDAERQRRQAAYQRQEDQALAEQNRQRDEQARHEATARAAAQKRIDVERARIEADEKRRQDIERSRIGG
jgi:hypothetical protein